MSERKFSSTFVVVQDVQDSYPSGCPWRSDSLFSSERDNYYQSRCNKWLPLTLSDSSKKWFGSATHFPVCLHIGRVVYDIGHSRCGILCIFFKDYKKCNICQSAVPSWFNHFLGFRRQFFGVLSNKRGCAYGKDMKCRE